MYLAFFDETKDGPEYPHYHIGGVCIEESCMLEVEKLLSELANKVFGTSELSKETEFHAVEIFHRKRAFKTWRNIADRLGVIEQLMQVMSREDVLLIDVQINCDKLYDNQKADEIAFMYFVERTNDLMKAKKSLGMLIGDRESDRVSERYARSLSAYRAAGTEFAHGRDINHLVDSVHFTHSHLSRFLQLADVYTWLMQFRNRNRGSKDPVHNSVFELFKKDGIDVWAKKYKEWPT
jgi:hypothetical protein